MDKWQYLDDAMVASNKKTIKELFAENPDRAKKFSLEAAGWFLDYSKNRVDEKAMKALISAEQYEQAMSELEAKLAELEA